MYGSIPIFTKRNLDLHQECSWIMSHDQVLPNSRTSGPVDRRFREKGTCRLMSLKKVHCLIICLLMCSWSVLVMFSRLYLGVHSPADIVSGTFSFMTRDFEGHSDVGDFGMVAVARCWYQNHYDSIFSLCQWLFQYGGYPFNSWFGCRGGLTRSEDFYFVMWCEERTLIIIFWFEIRNKKRVKPPRQPNQE